jgi:hypothetical protein
MPFLTTLFALYKLLMIQSLRSLKAFYFSCNLMWYILCDTLPVATLALARDQGKGVARLRAYK